jgi:hypothetical protein
VVCRCVLSRNVVNEDALAHWGGGCLPKNKQTKHLQFYSIILKYSSNTTKILPCLSDQLQSLKVLHNGMFAHYGNPYCLQSIKIRLKIGEWPKNC